MRTPLTDHPDAPLYDSFSQIHRAVVQYSSTTTGEIQVVIPSVTGIYTTVPISYYGREAHPFENDWVVPNVGDTIIVCREDEDYTNVFWINTTYNPVRADVGEVNPTGRTAQGVIFAKPDKNDRIIGVARNVEKAVEEEVEGAPEGTAADEGDEPASNDDTGASEATAEEDSE